MKKRAVVICVALISLATQACHSGSPSSEGNNKSQRTHTPGKPGASVSIRNTQPIVLDAGIQELTLVLLAPGEPERLTVQLGSTDGLGILSPTNAITLTPSGTSEYHLPLSLNVKRGGRHYVQLHIELGAGDERERRVISAIIQAGQPTARAQKAAPPNDRDGVKSLPAQEQVSPRD